MAFGLLKTYQGTRLVEWRSKWECWDHITSNSYVGTDGIEQDKIDFNVDDVVDFIIKEPFSLGISPISVDILYKLKNKFPINDDDENKYHRHKIEMQISERNCGNNINNHFNGVL